MWRAPQLQLRGARQFTATILNECLGGPSVPGRLSRGTTMRQGSFFGAKRFAVALVG
jgi:hypothetical protein